MTKTPRIRWQMIAAISLGALLLASCGSGETRRRGADGSIMPTAAELDPAGTLYARTVGQAQSGDCGDDTLNVLTCFAYRGHGYEGAQTALGECLIRKKQTPQGIVWLKRAANAGWADAQKRLAELYANGESVPQDNPEAAAWSYLYLRNPSLLSLGVRPDPALANKLQDRLNAEENNAARQKAASWTPSYWEPDEALNPETAATCRVKMKRPRPQVEPLMPDTNTGGY